MRRRLHEVCSLSAGSGVEQPPGVRKVATRRSNIITRPMSAWTPQTLGPCPNEGGELTLPTPEGGGFSNYTPTTTGMLAFDGSIRAKITSAAAVSLCVISLGLAVALRAFSRLLRCQDPRRSARALAQLLSRSRAAIQSMRRKPMERPNKLV